MKITRRGAREPLGGNRIRDIPTINLDSLEGQLNNMFMEEFERNHSALLYAQILDNLDRPAETEEDKTHFVGFNYSVGESLNLNGGLIDWSVNTEELSDELYVNDSSSSISITTTDGKGPYSSGDIYIGDPPQQDVQTFDGFGNPIDPNWANQPNQLLQPYTITTAGSSTGFNFELYSNTKYAIVELDREDVPMAVYVCGRMLTLGILGTDVECAFTGDKLVFEPGVISAISLGGIITMSIEYDDEIRHFNIGEGSTVTYESDRSSTLVVTPVSTIAKKKGSHLSGAQ